jgi:hypothetical protein
MQSCHWEHPSSYIGNTLLLHAAAAAATTDSPVAARALPRKVNK